MESQELLLRVKNIVAKALRKGALGGRKPLGQPIKFNSAYIKLVNKKTEFQHVFSFTEKGTGASKLTFDGNKKKTNGRKALSNISNSRKQQLNVAPKKNLRTKVSVVSEEDFVAICEEGFLHHHEECIKAHTKATDIDEFLKTVGLKNNDFPMQQSASSSKVAKDDLLSEDEFPLKHDEDTIDDFDIMSFESPNFTLVESP